MGSGPSTVTGVTRQTGSQVQLNLSGVRGYMNRIVDGLVYDTETATKVAEWRTGYGRAFYAFDEAIFVTKNGRWFRAGHGGPKTVYRQQAGVNTYSSGWGLIPLTDDEALQLLETRGEIKAIEEHFTSRLQEA